MKVIDYLGETPNSFALKLGYQRAQTIYDIQKMKSAPSYDFFLRFMNAGYSEIINLDWLLSGKGDMLCKNEPSLAINQKYEGAPYYNVDFIGGFDIIINNQTINPDYYINYPPYNKEGVIWCNLTGHSMEPELSNGDIIALKEVVNTPIQYLPSGEIYGIVTEEYRTVKRIRPSAKEGYVKLIPSNKSEEYCEQEIPISMILKIYTVLGSIRKFF